ncbi:TRAP transporter large permease [Limnohabitans planktonicus]|uniref:TRAP transporter large permease protein n=1 Tax=Limnohabitans planktonicus II-D5 TaxID=1293045 RepID=A0A2T7UIF4_9BURK|nr:TRAP transporter large permease subunit [Limnohabitans planktonicus]PVE44460.1 L-dehydroascorbate transporter large permease subunit [Limnohabitans planktonicus II-D5]|eukprot:gene26050-32579_t
MTVIVFIVSLLAAMALGMPLAFSLLVSGVALMLHLDNFDTQIVSQNLINGADNFPLMAVPFFMLAGELMNAGGMSRRIVNSAMVWVGHFRGGLGYVAVFAAIVMASLSGSAVADTAALAAVLLPMMRKAGYRMDRSAGLIAAGGIIAPVIPPSIGFILFGVIGGVSISKLFMAGIFPGLMMGFALIVTWWIVARKDKVEVAEKVPFKERISVTINAFWSYLLAITIIGGMKMGVFTPTEAAVVAVVYSLFVGLFIYREIKFKDLYGIILAAAKTSSVVMFLVAAALVSAWLITVANIPAQIVEILRPFIDNKTLLMVMLMLLVMIVGTALDFAPTVLILTPVLMPLVREAGIDPVYFGVLFIMNNAIGLLTPPVGTVLNVVCGVGRIPMHDVIRGVMPFLISQVVVMGSLIAFPSLVMVPLKWLLMR